MMSDQPEGLAAGLAGPVEPSGVRPPGPCVICGLRLRAALSQFCHQCRRALSGVALATNFNAVMIEPPARPLPGAPGKEEPSHDDRGSGNPAAGA
jgi:hypothetical protein